MTQVTFVGRSDCDTVTHQYKKKEEERKKRSGRVVDTHPPVEIRTTRPSRAACSLSHPSDQLSTPHCLRQARRCLALP
jgi:hypothetical protein